MYELTIRGRPYLYFWHYETRGGVRRQIKEYLGPADSPQTRQEAVRRCEGYYARMAQELRRLREATLTSIGLARRRVMVKQP